jgi:hypothetical protein
MCGSPLSLITDKLLILQELQREYTANRKRMTTAVGGSTADYIGLVPDSTRHKLWITLQPVEGFASQLLGTKSHFRLLAKDYSKASSCEAGIRQ